jgi:hypothetical protein
MLFSYTNFFFVDSGLHFFPFVFSHFGWSALWLSQTVLVFKLAHNLLINEVSFPIFNQFGLINESKCFKHKYSKIHQKVTNRKLASYHLMIYG